VGGISSGSNTATSIITASSISTTGTSSNTPAKLSHHAAQGGLSLRARIEGAYYVPPSSSATNPNPRAPQQQQRKGREAPGVCRPPLVLPGLHDSGCEITHVPRAINMASMGR
jgi:hypothetical protein